MIASAPFKIVAASLPTPIRKRSNGRAPMLAMAGMRAHHPLRGCARNSGRRSKTKTGRSCRCGFHESLAAAAVDFRQALQYIGGAGGAGEGYGAPSAVARALANRKYGRFSVSMQRDGDLMYGPGVLWMLAHHQVPLLSVMHNNRAYHQEVMHLQPHGDRHERGITRAGIGTTIDSPQSITPSWRKAWEFTAKDRLRIRESWAGLLSGRRCCQERQPALADRG